MGIFKFLDKLEDHVRGWFSHYPLVYGLVVGIGIVWFWRGVWHTTDYLIDYATRPHAENQSLDLSYGLWWDGPLSLLVGSVVLLLTGGFVSSFIGNEIIITGLRGEKKLTEKTESEVRNEVGAIADIKAEVKEISKRLDQMK
jgi:hypothetical protein